MYKKIFFVLQNIIKENETEEFFVYEPFDITNDLNQSAPVAKQTKHKN
jgi:hypothetical protein